MSFVLSLLKSINTKDTKGDTRNTERIFESPYPLKLFMHENELAHKVIGLAIEVHDVLGPGLLEKAYEECLHYKIIKSGLRAEKQKAMPLVYEEIHMECGYRLDILVENKLVIEVKSVEAVHPIFLTQTLTYMRLGGYKLGLLINFNVILLKDGIKRIINGTL